MLCYPVSVKFNSIFRRGRAQLSDFFYFLCQIWQYQFEHFHKIFEIRFRTWIPSGYTWLKILQQLNFFLRFFFYYFILFLLNVRRIIIICYLDPVHLNRIKFKPWNLFHKISLWFLFSNLLYSWCMCVFVILAANFPFFLILIKHF